MATLPSGDSGTANSLTHASTTAAQQKTNFSNWRTFIADLLGTDSGNKPAARAALGTLDAMSRQGFRLTLTTGLPVTTADVVGASTLYACPYKGDEIALYDGTKWVLYASNQFSLALSGLTSGRPYDVFCYANAGVPTLEFLAWTSDTARATALVYQDGVLVKTGATTRRYLGTFYTTAATTTEDSAAKRYLWNYSHRVRRPMMAALETTDQWTYSTATWRQANANAANQLNFVMGVAEDAVRAEVNAVATSSTATNQTVRAAVGLDTTTAATGYPRQGSCASSYGAHPVASYVGIPAAGRHFLAWLEQGSGADVQTWYGDNGMPLNLQSGIEGDLLA